MGGKGSPVINGRGWGGRRRTVRGRGRKGEGGERRGKGREGGEEVCSRNFQLF